MDFKHLSWILAIIGFFTHIFGLLKFIAFINCLIFFVIGCLCAIYIQRKNLDHFLNETNIKNPLESKIEKPLGLNLVCDQKPIILISPNVKIQTDKETKKKYKLKEWYQYHQQQQQQRNQSRHHGLLNNSSTSKLGIISLSQKQKQLHTTNATTSTTATTTTIAAATISSSSTSSSSSVPSLLVEPNNDTKKRSILDTGLDLLFKKQGKYHGGKGEREQQEIKLLSDDFLLDTTKNASNNNNSTHTSHSSNTDHLKSKLSLTTTPITTTNTTTNEDKKWKPFENIKIYTEKRKSSSSSQKYEKIEPEQVQYGEDCTSGAGIDDSNETSSSKYFITLSSDAHLLDEDGSPKKKQRTMLSGNKQIDQLLHTIIDYILRDFIDSWFCSLSDNKEFSEFRVRNCIEECLTNVCQRIKNTEWIPLMTTKLIDDLATHTRLYRNASQSVNTQKSDILSKMNNDDKSSPQKKSKKTTQHKRNKSDTDLEWYLGSQKTIANSKFYVESKDDPTVINDPEIALLKAFFSQNDLFQKECMDDHELKKYLTHVVETILYFTLPEEDFACIPLRTFLSTLLANVVFKPFLDTLSDPDFINLQVAKLFAKEPPPVEYFVRALRQSTDLSELRACRQLVIQEMSAKIQEISNNTGIGCVLVGNAELSSLKFAQKLIDIRISYLTNSRDLVDTMGAIGQIGTGVEKMNTLPQLSLDELLFKELARSYFLDYLSVLNLQKYVIFYLTADEWKCVMNQTLVNIQANKIKGSKDEIFKNLRDKAHSICKEYLTPGSQNYLTIDQGLIEALFLKLNNTNLNPDHTWFDSIMKYIYEKLKNEDVFLPKFYQSSGYKKLLLELEVVGQHQESFIDNLQQYSETGSDTNSGDINFTDDDITASDSIQIKTELDTCPRPDLLNITGFKHSRSHSDCTGISYSDLNLPEKILLRMDTEQNSDSDLDDKVITHQIATLIGDNQERARSAPSSRPSSGTTARSSSTPSTKLPSFAVTDSPKAKQLSANETPTISLDTKRKLKAKIINTAILSEGQYAVYAIQVFVIEDGQEKSWHIYRRYSKFLELKKLLSKRYPAVGKIPFPAKKAFQNTQRAVLEHRMDLLNEFLRRVCTWAENNEEMMRIIRGFLEPDTDDRKIHAGTVIRTIEHIVNPLKTGMHKIRNMPDTLVGGFSKILMGKGPLKESSFLEVNNLEQASEYPALASVIHLLDEIFDLQARSQWLRRGLINRVLGAPWVSHTANKKIIHVAKFLIETDKIEHVLSAILNNIWPHGKQQKRSVPREDSTKLRTRIAAQMALFALVFDDLKRVVGSETTRSGLLNCFGMWQHRKLNLRLVLILMNDILTTMYHVESMTKHKKN